MPDREKVIRAVDSCFNYWLEQHRFLHPLHLENVRQFKADAIALLKEQEAVKPKLVGPSMWRCGKCDALLGWEEFARSGVELVEYKFCPECGKKVKWE